MRIRLLLVVLALVLALGLAVWWWRPVRLQTYLLSSDVSSGWIVVEFGNPHCPSIQEARLWREFVIPSSGYLCTSSSMEPGLVYERFYLVDREGNRRALKISDWIHVRATTLVNEPECNLTAKTFWYGPKGGVSGHSSDVIRRYHPACPTI